MAVCLAAGALMIVIPTTAFVLSWTHSVEHTLWRENWRVSGDALVLDEAAVQGSGAGMEAAADARLVDGAWRYRPVLPPLQRLRLAHSEFAGDYRLCWSNRCEMLANLVARGHTEALEIFPCGLSTRADETGAVTERTPARADAREEMR